VASIPRKDRYANMQQSVLFRNNHLIYIVIKLLNVTGNMIR